MICRAHQLVMEGYKWHFNETVLTVWSAPNYCYRCGNVAAILELDEHLARNFTIFEAAPQEARGVGGGDLIEWAVYIIFTNSGSGLLE